MYTAALVEYVTDPDESSLRQAQELGCQAILDGLGMWEVAAAHHNALRAILYGTPGIEHPRAARPIPAGQSTSTAGRPRVISAEASSRTLSAGKAFFAETLLPFEAEQRELRDERAALLARSETLEARALAFSEDARQLLRSLRRVLDGAAHANGSGDLRGVRELLESAERQAALLSRESLPNPPGELRPSPPFHPAERVTEVRRSVSGKSDRWAHPSGAGD